MNILKFIKNNIPNSITCLNLVSGCLACIYAFHSTDIYGSLYGYQISFIMIALAAVFDFCDGLVARMLHAVSAIGKELDSLCDSVSFGLAPALLVYSMIEHFYPESCWKYAALLIAVCGVLRLARFNVDATQSTSFLGMPIPANAIFWIGFCCSQYADYGLQAATDCRFYTIVALTIVMSLIMVCRLRMFSFKFKSFALATNWHRYLLIVVSVAFVAIWGVSGLAGIIIFYIILSALTHKMTKKLEA